MSKRGENIYKRKDGRWEGRFRMENGRYTSVYGKTYRETKQKLEQRKKDTQLQIKLPPASVAALCRTWMEDNRKRLKPSTYVKYRNILEGHIIPRLGDRSVHTLQRWDLENFARDLAEKGRQDGKGGLSERTVNDILKLLASIWKDAVLRKKTANFLSFEGLAPGRVRGRVDVLQKAECRTLEAYLSRETDLTKCGVLLALYTGLRIGELCALRWDHIDLTSGTLQVAATMQRLQDFDHSSRHRTNVVCLPPKTATSMRTIPIPDAMVQRLKNMEPSAPDAFFLSGKANRFVEPRTFSNRFKRCLQQCDLRDVNFHTLRHTFATRCVEVGFDTKSLSEILGHANVQITMSLYVHPTMEYKRENMNKLTFG